MLFLGAWIICVACNGAITRAADTPAPADVTKMEAVVVTGEQPGPGLWKVQKGDHVLWLLGSLSPLPKKMTWRTKEVDALVAQSQAVIMQPRVDVDADIGFFGKLMLLPSLIGVRNSPEGRTLQQVVPADEYARWLVLKQRYMGHNNKVEKWRPIFAAMELYRTALDRSGLTGLNSNLVEDKVAEAAKRAHIQVTVLSVELKVEQPRQAVKEFKNTSMDDQDCFRKTLDRIDTDLGTMTERANAWATGDLDALRKLPYTDQLTVCEAALSATGLGRRLGGADLDARIRQKWLDTVSSAVDKNTASIAVLPIRRLLSADDGYLSGLAARGYSIQAPDAQDESGAVHEDKNP
jgi:uncharacterized protein YbaP (TraB family)